MADGKIIIETDLDSKGFEVSLSKLGGIATKGSKVAIGAIAGVTTAVGSVATASIKVGIDFESSMSQVAATMGITAQEIANGSESFEILKQAAKEAGSTTQFSASQSAEALNYLALAGYDAEKAVKALPTVLNLAAAGGLELGYASDLVTDSMSALGLKTTDLEGFVDQLAKTSQKSNTSVGQLGEAILTVGGTAKVLAGGTTELNTVLGILADNSVKGAEGGTALRNIILSLSAPTDKARGLMKDLGLEVLDAEGNMRPLNEIFGDLNDKLSTMTQGERTEVLSNLFNKVDLRSVNALLANSGERFDELSGYIDNADGAAAAMAETMNDNLKGRLTQLGSALEGLGIDIYENMEVPLKSMAENAISSVGKLHSALKNNGLDGLVSEIGTVLSDMINQVANFAPKFIELAVDLIKSFINGISANLPSLVDNASKIVDSLVTGIVTLLPDLLDVGLKVILELIKGISNSLPTLIPITIDAILTIVDTLIENVDLLTDAAIALALGLADGLINSLPIIIEKVPQIISNLSNAFSENAATLIIAAGQLMIALTTGLIQSIPTILMAIPEILQAICDFFLSGVNTLVEIGKQLALVLWNSIKGECINGWNNVVAFFTETIPAWIDNFKEWWNGLPEYFSELWVQVSEKFTEWGTNITNFFTETIPMWIENIATWFNELPFKIGEALGLALGNIVNWGVESWNYLVTNVPIWINNVSKWFSELPGKIWTWLSNAIQKIVQWGTETYNKAKQYVNQTINSISQYFSELPGKVWKWLSDTVQKMIQWGTDMLNKGKKAASDTAKAIVDGFKNLPKNMLDIGKSVVKGIWDGIMGMKDWIGGKISGFCSGIVDGFKGALKINSPSKIMRDKIGKGIVEGIDVGIEKEMPNLDKDINSQMINLAARMRTTVDIETSKVSSNFRDYSTTQDYSDNFSDKVLDILEGFTNVIVTQIDGKTVAQTTAPFINEEIAYILNSKK